MRRPTAARKQALVTSARYVLTCLQEEVLKTLLLLPSGVCWGDDNRGLGDVRLTWKCCVSLKGLRSL